MQFYCNYDWLIFSRDFSKYGTYKWNKCANALYNTNRIKLHVSALMAWVSVVKYNYGALLAKFHPEDF